MDWLNWIMNVLENLVVAGVSAGVGALLMKSYTKKIIFSRELKKAGFTESSLKRQSNHELYKMFTDANKVKIINVAGTHFMLENEKIIKKAIQEGTTVQFLCANPLSSFCTDIENLERGIGARDDTTISNEVYEIIRQFPSLDIRFFNSEYRLPIVIAEYPDGSTKIWLTITLPPYKSTQSLILRGGSSAEEEASFVEMVQTHFNSVWDNSVGVSDLTKLDEVVHSSANDYIKAYHYWKTKLDIAIRKKKGDSTLIEIAAQHPLLDGSLPNEEFKARLDRAIELGKSCNDTFYYVPGSRHMLNGVADDVSLSSAGKKYLIDNGVSADRIFGDEMNDRYKGSSGVYNSTDECFVASSIFKDGNYSELYCVCSPVQSMRKVFSYLEFGVLPKVVTAPTEHTFHNYVDEYFRNIPIVLFKDHSLQGKDSVEANSLRNERKPR